MGGHGAAGPLQKLLVQVLVGEEQAAGMLLLLLLPLLRGQSPLLRQEARRDGAMGLLLMLMKRMVWLMLLMLLLLMLLLQSACMQGERVRAPLPLLLLGDERLQMKSLGERRAAVRPRAGLHRAAVRRG